jgi:hypothetical protein
LCKYAPKELLVYANFLSLFRLYLAMIDPKHGMCVLWAQVLLCANMWAVVLTYHHRDRGGEEIIVGAKSAASFPPLVVRLSSSTAPAISRNHRTDRGVPVVLNLIRQHELTYPILLVFAHTTWLEIEHVRNEELQRGPVRQRRPT